MKPSRRIQWIIGLATLAGFYNQTACATCHHHAGVDSRVTNIAHPGADGNFTPGNAYLVRRESDPRDARARRPHVVDPCLRRVDRHEVGFEDSSDLIALAKKQPGSIAYASAGGGTLGRSASADAKGLSCCGDRGRR